MASRRSSRSAVEVTQRIRKQMMETGDRSACLGCGKEAHGEGFLGTSRWNPKANLCSECCTLEALSGRTDPFGLAVLKGGRDYKAE